MAGGAGFPQTLVRQFRTRALYDKEGSPAKEELKRIRWAIQGSTIQLISNCEGIDDWDVGSTTNFACVAEAAVYRGGNGSLELVNTTTTEGDTLTLDEAHRPQSEDWSDMNWLGFWVYDVTTARTATYNYKFQIRNAGVWSAEQAFTVGLTADRWYHTCYDIIGLNRNSVDGFRIVHRRGANAGALVYVDDIIVTDIIAGAGITGAVAVGPCIGGSIKSYRVATGSTVVPGDAVSFDIEGGVITGGTNLIIGVAMQETLNAAGWASTDTAIKEVLVATSGALAFRNDATGCTIANGAKLGSDVVTKSAGIGTADGELTFAKCLETSTGAALKDSDSYYQLMSFPTEN